MHENYYHAYNVQDKQKKLLYYRIVLGWSHAGNKFNYCIMMWQKKTHNTLHLTPLSK